METETKSYNFTEKRAAQLEKARQKRWELGFCFDYFYERPPLINLIYFYLIYFYWGFDFNLFNLFSRNTKSVPA